MTVLLFSQHIGWYCVMCKASFLGVMFLRVYVEDCGCVSEETCLNTSVLLFSTR